VCEAALSPTIQIPQFDTSFFSGTYLIGESIQDAYFDRLHNERNHSAKEQCSKRGHDESSNGSATPAKKPMASDDGCEPVSNDTRHEDASAACEPFTNQPVGLVR
jgi:hypothetical protein